MCSFKRSALAFSTLRIYSLFHCPLLAILIEVLSVSELSHSQCTPKLLYTMNRYFRIGARKKSNLLVLDKKKNID